ncbi:hypothetical protein V2I78_19410 [Pseudomonas viridiflava]|uniref:hypothetical protein n=1 Tax=Pseudomonas viridiflava TaxID=33069 RepID=UPI002ECACEF0|nr:hypothetical protein [Pseudomonas viridiflava]
MKPPRNPVPCSEVIVRFIRQDLVSEQDLAQLPLSDIAFTGADDLDDRSGYSVERSTRLGDRVFRVRYNPDTFCLEVGNKSYMANHGDLEDLSRDFKAISIVIDATTLDFSEIALLLYAYSLCPKSPILRFLYVEPKEYVRRTYEESAVNGTAFDLSSSFNQRPSPPFVGMLGTKDSVHLVAFLGFEGGRLTRVLSNDDGQFIRKVTIVFGIPPFQASWDLEALMANSRLLETSEAGVKFCGANNPKAAYEILVKAHAALTGNSECNRLTVSPFGTKPMAIGAALFCATQKLPRVIFDHPQRKKGRTKGVQCVHWYEVDIN